MSFRQKLHILLMDGSSWWVPIMKKGLELLAPEFRVSLAETEADAVGLCVKEQSSVVILDPEDFQSVYLIQTLRKIPGERLYLLLVSPEALSEQRKIHQLEGDVLLLVRPCSFKIVYQNIQSWTYGKKLAISNDVCDAYLKRWGFSSTCLGFRYLCDALAEYSMDRRQPMKSIYATLEQRFNNSEKNIQYAIRSAVKNAWKTGRMEKQFNHIPNNKELLMALCKELDKRA